MANEVKLDEEFASDDEPAAPAAAEPEEEEVVEEEPEEEEPPAAPAAAEPAPAPAAKYYTFNGRQLTAEELHQEATLLQAEYTRRNQEPTRKDAVPPVVYDAKQIDEFKKFGKAIGLVFAEDVQKSKEKEIWDGFVSAHPEYGNPVEQRKLYDSLLRYNNALPYLKDNLEEVHARLHPLPPESDAAAEARLRARAVAAKRGAHAAGGTPPTKPRSNSSAHSPESIAIAKKMGVWDE